MDKTTYVCTACDAVVEIKSPEELCHCKSMSEPHPHGWCGFIVIDIVTRQPKQTIFVCGECYASFQAQMMILDAIATAEFMFTPPNARQRKAHLN